MVGRIRLALVVLLVALTATVLSVAAYDHIDFEGLPLGTLYTADLTPHNGGGAWTPSTFVDADVDLYAWGFAEPGESMVSFGGHVEVVDFGCAGGSGKELRLSHARVGFYVADGEAVTEVFVKYGHHSGSLNLEINGLAHNISSFYDVDGWYIGGVRFEVYPGATPNTGTLVLTGDGTPIWRFEVGGQDLCIDDLEVLFESEALYPLEIHFADGSMDPGKVYEFDESTGTTGVVYSRSGTHDSLDSFLFAPWNLDRLFFVNANKRNIYVKDPFFGAGPEVTFYTHTTYVRDIAIGPDGALYFSEACGACGDGKIWRLASDTTSASLYYTVALANVDGYWSGDFAFSREGTLYLSGGNIIPGKLYEVDVAANAVTKLYTDPNEPIEGLALGSSTVLYYANGNSRIYELHLATGFRRAVFEDAGFGDLSDVAFRPSGAPSVSAPVATWIMPWGVGGTRLDRINHAFDYTEPASGTTDYTWRGIHMSEAPFGGRLGFRLGASAAIPTASISHYRFLYQRIGEAAWHEFTEPVTVYYVREVPGLPPQFPVYELGPKAIAGMNLYEFRPHSPPSDPGATVYWPTEGYLGDIYRGFLLSGGLSPGKYYVRLEIYNAAGTLLRPGIDGFDFVAPTGELADGTITTAVKPGVNHGIEFVLHIDNRHADATIDVPMIGTKGADACGFLRYKPGDSTPVTISYHAVHPDNRAVFSFGITRAASYVPTSTVFGEEVSSTSPGTYTGNGFGSFWRDFALADLLGSCTEAAFSINLHVYAKATNGWTRLSALDDHAVRAFALAPE
jgi:hypothetical protein